MFASVANLSNPDDDTQMDYQCPNCRQQIWLPENSAGMNLPCPKCAQTIAVAASFAPVQAVPAVEESFNPYAAPQTSYVPPSFSNDGPMSHQIVSAGEVISYCWEVWKANLGLLLGGLVVIGVISFVTSGVAQVLLTAIVSAAGRNMGVLILAALILQFAQTAVQTFLSIGYAQIQLKLLRGQPAAIGDLFGGGERFWPVLGVSILAGIALLFGFLLLIIPGIILLLMFWPCYMLVLDGKSRVMDSFGMASQLTVGNKGTTFVLWLASIGIMILGFLALVIGLIFAVPLVSLLFPAAYLMMSGQIGREYRLG